MESLTGKSEAIRSAVAMLRERFGSQAIDVGDWWPGDAEQIGIARLGSEEPGVCILTAGKAEGRFDAQHGGKVDRDCLIQGLCWAVSEELGRRVSQGTVFPDDEQYRVERQAECGGAPSPWWKDAMD